MSPGYTPPDTNVSDPLDTVLGTYEGPLNGDSSVTPNTGANKNYNFAIARVRLNGSSGPSAAAQNVKVFFRMFTTQTFDTDFINSVATSADPQVTYPSQGSLTDPTFPMPGTNNTGTVNGCSLPFFATANYNDNPTDYNTTGPNNTNNQTIEIPHGDSRLGVLWVLPQRQRLHPTPMGILTTNPSNIGWPAAPTTASSRRLLISILQSKTPAESSKIRRTPTNWRSAISR